MLMLQIYTENELLLYIYGELSQKDSQAIERELAVNKDLQTKFYNLKSAIGLIAELEEEPSKTSIDLVMEYSKTVSETSTEKV